MPQHVGLLRGINVSGHNRIPMPELRSLCQGLGWRDVESYIQSGNLIFRAEATPAALERELEGAIEQHFGLSIPVLVSTAAAWRTYARSNPYLEASESEPNLVMLALSKSAPRPEAVHALQKRTANGERITQVGNALWIHYVGGAGRSKLTPALLNRLIGSAVTTRNWRTVLRLLGMVHASDPDPQHA